MYPVHNIGFLSSLVLLGVVILTLVFHMHEFSIFIWHFALSQQYNMSKKGNFHPLVKAKKSARFRGIVRHWEQDSNFDSFGSVCWRKKKQQQQQQQEPVIEVNSLQLIQLNGRNHHSHFMISPIPFEMFPLRNFSYYLLYFALPMGHKKRCFRIVYEAEPALSLVLVHSTSCQHYTVLCQKNTLAWINAPPTPPYNPGPSFDGMDNQNRKKGWKRQKMGAIIPVPYILAYNASF